jgi:hypothetical protein
MKKSTKIMIIAVIPAVPIIAFGIYLVVNLQGVIEPFEVNSPDAKHKVLIASQGSRFKNMLVSGLVDRIKDTPTYIRVIDVTSLSEVSEADWNAVVLIHTTQGGRMQPDAREYLGRAKELDKVILVSTSGSGKWRTEEFDIDTLTSASRKAKVGPLTNTVTHRLEAILRKPI